MLVFEFKAYGKQYQFNAVDEAIRTAISDKFSGTNCFIHCIELILLPVGFKLKN